MWKVNVWLNMSSVCQEEVMEQGRIQIAHVEADVLRRSGASLQTMQATPRTPDSTQVRTPEPLPANVYLFLTWSVVLFT